MNDAKAPSIFRIFIPVSDFDKAVSFYRRLFDDDGREIHRGRHYFDCGPVTLAIIENNGTPIGDHVYFSTGDLDAVFARASELDCVSPDDVHGSPSARSMCGRGASGRSMPATHLATASALLMKQRCLQERNRC